MNKSVTPRENLLSLYRRQGYAYAPVLFGLCESQIKQFTEKTGETDFTQYFDFPVRAVPMLSYENKQEKFHKYFAGLKADSVIDEWGVAYEKGSEAAFHMSRMRHPLQNLESIDKLVNYPWPDYFPAKDYKVIVDNIHASGLAAIGGYECTIWERAWYIRSMEGLMADMMDEDDKAVYLLDKVTELACQNAAHFAHAGIDILCLGDDIGMQHSVMMGPELYRSWLLPRLKKVIDTAKAIYPEILVQYHSCGYIEPFINDLCDAGVDILNPVQPECMDFAEIHAKYGHKLSFNGTLGTQSTMPFGTPEDVREVVNKNLNIAGQKGGLLVCPTHILEPEVPWENVIAYVNETKQFKP